MGTITPRQFLTGLAVVLFWLLIVVFGGGLTLLATQLGLALTLAATPILLLLRNRPAFLQSNCSPFGPATCLSMS
jgi:hypothetical protein